jgi:hypothetical protein
MNLLRLITPTTTIMGTMATMATRIRLPLDLLRSRVFTRYQQTIVATFTNSQRSWHLGQCTEIYSLSFWTIVTSNFSQDKFLQLDRQ